MGRQAKRVTLECIPLQLVWLVSLISFHAYLNARVGLHLLVQVDEPVDVACKLHLGCMQVDPLGSSVVSCRECRVGGHWPWRVLV